MKLNFVYVALIITIIILLFIIFFQSRNQSASEQNSGSEKLNALDSLYQGRTKNTFNGNFLFAAYTSNEIEAKRSKKGFHDSSDRSAGIDSIVCERWAVLTTTVAPTFSVQKQAHVPNWCLVVVADRTTPENYHIESPLKNFVFLSVKHQTELIAAVSTGGQGKSNYYTPSQHNFMKNLPWDHVGRKNAGYLYAIMHGAKYVWDFEDDISLLSKRHAVVPPGEVPVADPLMSAVTPSGVAGSSTATTAGAIPSAVSNTSAFASTSTSTGTEAKGKAAATEGEGAAWYSARISTLPQHDEVFNPFPLFDANHNPSWPRGFPSERILAKAAGGATGGTGPTVGHDITAHTSRTTRVPARTIGVVQYLANNDPDVDALYRLIRPLPLDFPFHGVLPLILPGSTTGTTSSSTPDPISDDVPDSAHTVYTPYNAQSTLHTQAALWAIMLPSTPHERVADIWRSYIAQRLFADIGVRVAIHSPIVGHFRRTNDTADNLIAELPLYVETLPLLRFLRQWRGQSSTLPGRLEELYVQLYELGYVGLSDVYLVQHWIAALLDTGYVFPPIVR
jgi:hypothetical protein